jgi:hypothetical protein
MRVKDEIVEHLSFTEKETDIYKVRISKVIESSHVYCIFRFYKRAT